MTVITCKEAGRPLWSLSKLYDRDAATAELIERKRINPARDAVLIDEPVAAAGNEEVEANDECVLEKKFDQSAATAAGDVVCSGVKEGKVSESSLLSQLVRMMDAPEEDEEEEKEENEEDDEVEEEDLMDLLDKMHSIIKDARAGRDSPFCPVKIKRDFSQTDSQVLHCKFDELLTSMDRSVHLMINTASFIAEELAVSKAMQSSPRGVALIEFLRRLLLSVHSIASRNDREWADMPINSSVIESDGEDQTHVQAHVQAVVVHAVDEVVCINLKPTETSSRERDGHSDNNDSSLKTARSPGLFTKRNREIVDLTAASVEKRPCSGKTREFVEIQEASTPPSDLMHETSTTARPTASLFDRLKSRQSEETTRARENVALPVIDTSFDLLQSQIEPDWQGLSENVVKEMAEQYGLEFTGLNTTIKVLKQMRSALAVNPAPSAQNVSSTCPNVQVNGVQRSKPIEREPQSVLRAQTVAAITGDFDLYQQVLTMTPIPVAEIRNRLATHGVIFPGEKMLIEVLDSLNVFLKRSEDRGHHRSMAKKRRS